LAAYPRRRACCRERLFAATSKRGELRKSREPIRFGALRRPVAFTSDVSFNAPIRHFARRQERGSFAPRTGQQLGGGGGGEPPPRPRRGKC
jgi:hypothetical protein